MPADERGLLVLGALEAVQVFSDALDQMKGSLRGEMGMNATDVAALRMLIMRERSAAVVQPQDIAKHLSISTASTTKLLDRLSRSGHVERRPHPRDRRARIVVLTDVARADFYRHFGERLVRMRHGMTEFTDDELRAIVRFLADMSAALTETRSP
ncbi:MarR family transcriptional regulator [Microbacterium sp.]|uniref:MarR family winged helix-turn-helix transcriptional regulator n=1 Tax=Microbacterium sp. TaxID=51671 RepID=UPI0025D9CC9A|nr:MarR family transcriptional regulator [Microbacterium sp.]